jgi:hypothetical protein
MMYWSLYENGKNIDAIKRGIADIHKKVKRSKQIG